MMRRVVLRFLLLVALSDVAAAASLLYLEHYTDTDDCALHCGDNDYDINNNTANITKYTKGCDVAFFKNVTCEENITVICIDSNGTEHIVLHSWRNDHHPTAVPPTQSTPPDVQTTTSAGEVRTTSVRSELNPKTDYGLIVYVIVGVLIVLGIPGGVIYCLRKRGCRRKERCENGEELQPMGADTANTNGAPKNITYSDEPIHREGIV